MPDPIADGVYFGLPEDRYHADLALGSTDLRRLSYSPADYWFESGLNPLKSLAEDGDDARTPSHLIVGRAIHKYTLEGEEAFSGLYAGCAHPGNVKVGIEERRAIRAQGKTPLRMKDYAAARMAGAMIRANPELANAFSGGFPEVSVFWTDARGVRRKARYDYLKPRAIVDLKSITNTLDLEFVAACRRRIAQLNYPLQAATYLDARQAMRDLPIYITPTSNISVEAADAIKEAYSWIKGQAPCAFVFIFYQKDGAPLTWGCSISPGNPVLEVGRRDVERAIDNYLRWMEKFGPSTPWVLAEPVRELDINDLPNWWGQT